MTKHIPHRPDLETLHARLLMYKLSSAEIDPLFKYVAALEQHAAALQDKLDRGSGR